LTRYFDWFVIHDLISFNSELMPSFRAVMFVQR